MCLNKLKTRDRLKTIGICQDTICPVCGLANETRDHLFFECPFSYRCLQLLRDATVWIRRRYKGSRVRKEMLFAILTATVHKVWVNRNQVCWDDKCANPKSVIKQLLEEVKIKILGMNMKRRSLGDRTCLLNLNVT